MKGEEEEEVEGVVSFVDVENFTDGEHRRSKLATSSTQLLQSCE